MDLTSLGVFCFLDPLPGPALGPFARRVEELGYSALWFAEGLGRESFSTATHLLDQTRRLVVGTGIAVLGSLHPQMIRLAAAETAGVLTYFTPPEKTAATKAAIGAAGAEFAQPA